jgi:hypothetical protein
LRAYPDINHKRLTKALSGVDPKIISRRSRIIRDAHHVGNPPHNMAEAIVEIYNQRLHEANRLDPTQLRSKIAFGRRREGVGAKS